MKGKKKAEASVAGPIAGRTEVVTIVDDPIASPLDGRPPVRSGGSYSEQFQQHPLAAAIVIGLGLFGGQWYAHELARFRDVAVFRRQLGAFDVQLLIRIGGDHRDRFRSTWDAIRAHPEYVSDADLIADPTYALVTFVAGPQWEVPVLIEAADQSFEEWEARVLALREDTIARSIGGA